jgi:hypothetical protein
MELTHGLRVFTHKLMNGHISVTEDIKDVSKIWHQQTDIINKDNDQIEDIKSKLFKT